jgi:hypothetical protein
MPRKTYGAEQIIGMLREADVAVRQGRTLSEVRRVWGSLTSNNRSQDRQRCKCDCFRR